MVPFEEILIFFLAIPCLAFQIPSVSFQEIPQLLSVPCFVNNSPQPSRKLPLFDKFSLIHGNSSLLAGNSLLCFQRIFSFNSSSSPVLPVKSSVLSRIYILPFFPQRVYFALLLALNSLLLLRIYCLLFLEVLIYFLIIPFFLSWAHFFQ